MAEKQTEIIKTIMKVTTEENNKQEIKYPFIGISDTQRIIVLFRYKGKGTVLEGGESHLPIGHTTEGFLMECYKPYKGKITLEND